MMQLVNFPLPGLNRMRLCLGLLLPIMALAASAAWGQTSSAQDFSHRPIFVNVNIFQLQVNTGAEVDLTDQVFKMKTTSLSEYEKWMRAFSKTYPGYEVALLRQESRRVFRTSKPSLVTVSRQVAGRSLVLELNGAQSPGDGVTPGTSLVVLLNLQATSDQVVKPVSYAITPIEVEHGMTYFYLIKTLRMRPSDYVSYLRPNESAEAFAGKEYYLIVGLSVDLDQTVTPPRLIDERQSARLQEEATRKAPLTVSETLRKSGLSGMVRVKVEISPEGKVTTANVAYSTLPEANAEAVAAARQWEFPTSLFAENKHPITGFLSFTIDQKRPAGDKQSPPQ